MIGGRRKNRHSLHEGRRWGEREKRCGLTVGGGRRRCHSPSPWAPVWGRRPGVVGCSSVPAAAETSKRWGDVGWGASWGGGEGGARWVRRCACATLIAGEGGWKVAVGGVGKPRCVITLWGTDTGASSGGSARETPQEQNASSAAGMQRRNEALRVPSLVRRDWQRLHTRSLERHREHLGRGPSGRWGRAFITSFFI